MAESPKPGQRCRVTFHRRAYEGELLYCATYPNAVRDEDGRVVAFRPHPQRVGLLIGGVSTHLTVPEAVEVDAC